MKNWEAYYNTVPGQISKNDYLRQVGKTVCGETISDLQFKLITNSIVDNLQINSNDIVLDLCCGNGLITKEIAGFCRNIVGVDFSYPLIEVARSAHLPLNGKYISKSILDLDGSEFDYKFTKVYMYEALQHFRPKQLYKILKLICEFSTGQVLILFGSIPDKNKLWKFYDKPIRKFDYYKRKLLNKEAIGVWWSKKIFYEICRIFNFDCFFINQNEILYTAHYRFDALISAKPNNDV